MSIEWPVKMSFFFIVNEKSEEIPGFLPILDILNIWLSHHTIGFEVLMPDKFKTMQYIRSCFLFSGAFCERLWRSRSSVSTSFIPNSSEPNRTVT